MYVVEQLNDLVVEDLQKFRKQGLTTAANIGCWDKTNTLQLWELGYEVTSFDLRPLDFPGFIQDDVLNIHNYGPFDVSYCNNLIHHLKTPRLFLEGLAKVSSYIILGAFYWKGDTEEHERLLGGWTDGAPDHFSDKVFMWDLISYWEAGYSIGEIERVYQAKDFGKMGYVQILIKVQ